MLRRSLLRLHGRSYALPRNRLTSTRRHASTRPPSPNNPPAPTATVSLPNKTLARRLPTLRLHPTLLATIRSFLAFYLTLHIFLTYFYSLDAAWGISMLPTIAASGESVVISKYYARGRDVKVGDVVSFRHPAKAGEYAVKRVVGVEGDFVVGGTPGKGRTMLQVPTGHCWVTGDNLTWSRDSRLFGPLPLALITGKVVGLWSWKEGWRRLDHDLKPALIEDDDVD